MGICLQGGKPPGILPQIPCNYSWPWEFITDIAATDPGVGKYKFNNANPAFATAIYISNTTQDSITCGDLLELFKKDNFFLIRFAAISLLYNATGAAVAHGAWTEIPINCISSNGTIANNSISQFIMWFPDTSDIPDCNYKLPFTYLSATTETDPGSGNFKLDNLDPSLALFLYISTTSQEGMHCEDLLKSFKEDNFFLIRTSTAYFLYTIMGSPIDNGNWLKIPISNHSASGTLSNNDLTQWVLWFPDVSGTPPALTYLDNDTGSSEDSTSSTNWRQVRVGQPVPSTLTLTAGTWLLNWQVEARDSSFGPSHEVRCQNITTAETIGQSWLEDVWDSGSTVYFTHSGFKKVSVYPNGGTPPFTYQIQFRSKTGAPTVVYARKARLFAIAL